MSHRHPAIRFTPHTAFTLIEMLVVISIITLLLSISAPSLQSAKESGRKAQCSSNIRQVMLCVLNYTEDEKGRMPGFYHDWYSHPPVNDWLMGRDANVMTCVGKGSVFRYGPDKSLYRCPSLAQGVFQSGVGSNGGFDLGFFIAFSGTIVTKIPSTAVFTLADGTKQTLPVPILCEEDPAAQINNSSPEPGHCAWDQQGKWHGGKGTFYASLDASTHFFNPQGATPAAYWAAKKPGGGYIGLDNWYGGNNYDSWGRY